MGDSTKTLIFKFVSITQVTRLNHTFYAACMEEGADLMQHITMMTSLAEQLRELEVEISSRKFATMILGSLPQSYDNLVSSLNAQTADELSWDNIKGPLIEEYMKRKNKRDQKHSQTVQTMHYSLQRDNFQAEEEISAITQNY